MQKNIEKKTRSKKPKNPNIKRDKAIVVAAVTASCVVILLIFNFFTSYISYGYTFVRCGFRQPLSASKFMSGYHYFAPGEVYYSVDMFSQYYCSEEEATKDGFRSAE